MCLACPCRDALREHLQRVAHAKSRGLASVLHICCAWSISDRVKGAAAWLLKLLYNVKYGTGCVLCCAQKLGGSGLSCLTRCVTTRSRPDTHALQLINAAAVDVSASLLVLLQRHHSGLLSAHAVCYAPAHNNHNYYPAKVALNSSKHGSSPFTQSLHAHSDRGCHHQHSTSRCSRGSPGSRPI